MSTMDDLELALATATQSIPPSGREEFLIETIMRLDGQTVGPGSLHRALAEAQRAFLCERPILSDGPHHPSKYARRRSPLVHTR